MGSARLFPEFVGLIFFNLTKNITKKLIEEA
jgi:hypothetical protein